MENLRFTDLLQMPTQQLLALYTMARAALAVIDHRSELAHTMALLVQNIERVLAWRAQRHLTPSP